MRAEFILNTKSCLATFSTANRAHQNNLFAQLFKSWPPGRAAGGKFLKSAALRAARGTNNHFFEIAYSLKPDTF